MISFLSDYPVLIVILFIFLGAWTGYITNDMAIKMLFKEYGIGKFKFGGVIVKTRKKLESSISQLVEKEIINHQTIKEQLGKKEVQDAIEDLVNNFFESILYKYVGDTKLTDIDQLEETVDNALDYVEKYLRDNLVYTFISVTRNMKVNDLLTEKQIVDFSYSFVDELISFLKKRNIIRALLNSFYRENSDISFERILSKETCQKIVGNLDGLFEKIWKGIYAKYHRQINIFVKKSINDLDLEAFVKKIETALFDKTLAEFINPHSLKYLSKILEKYLDTEYSKITFENLFSGTLKSLKQMEKPVSSLFSKEVKVYITNIIKEQLPSIIKGIIDLISENRYEFEEIIENLIDEVISEKKKVKRTLLVAVRKYLMENITEKYGLINKVINKLESIDINSASETLTSQVLEYLSEKKISEIIIELEENDSIDLEETAAVAYKTINAFMKKNVDTLTKINLENIKIGQLFTFDLYKLIDKNLENYIIKEAFQNEKVIGAIKSFIFDKVSTAFSYPLNFCISKKTFDLLAVKSQILVEKYLDENKLKVKGIVSNFLINELDNKTIAELFREDKINQSSINSIVDVIMKTFRGAFVKYSDVSTHKILENINSDPHLKSKITKMIINFLDNGMGKLIEGKIAGVVKKNLEQLNDEEILIMMQDFMGRRLKPLTILGAILGGLTGVGLGVAVVRTNMDLQWYYLLMIAVPVYGILGFMTNVMAIFFIFRPYKPLFGIKKIQGIISKQIPIFAKSMGKVLTEHLMTDESIKRILNDNEQKVKDFFNNNLKDDNMKVIREYLLENTVLISNMLSVFTIRYMRNNAENLNDQLIKTIENFELNKIDFNDFSHIVLDSLLEKIDKQKFVVAKPILELIQTDKTLNEIFSEAFNENSDKYISDMIEKQIQKITENENDDALLMLFYKLDKIFYKYFEQKICDVIDFSNTENITEYIISAISNNVLVGKSRAGATNYVVSKIREIQETNLVGELFSGKIFEFITKKITMYSIHYEEKIISWFKSNEEQMYSTISDQVKKEIGFIKKIGYNAIDGDALIKDVITKMINNEMPKFIHNKMSFFTEIIKQQLDILAKREVGDFDINIDFESIFFQLKNAIESEEFKKHINVIIDINKELIINATLNDCLRVLDIHSIYDLMVRFDKELKYITKEFKLLLEEHKNVISRDLSIILNQIVTKDVMRLKVSDITKGIDIENIESCISNSHEVFVDNNYLSYETFEVLEAVFNHFSQFKLSEIINIEYLRRDLDNVISKLNYSEEFNRTLSSTMYKVTSYMVDDLDNIIDPRLLDYICEVSGNVLYATTQEHFLKIITAIDFKEIAERQIMKMEPKQIKELFDTFASKYFRKLERYGFIGGLFAIDFITVLSFLTYSIVNIKAKKDKTTT